MSYKAKQKLEALILWENHNIKASMDAYHISKSSLYEWRRQYRLYGINGLINQSTCPRQPRRRDWPEEIIDEIRRHRENYPYGAPKIYLLIQPWCDERGLRCPKPRTIARLIAGEADKMRWVPAKPRRQRTTQSKSKERLEKGFNAKRIGHCIAMDTVQRFIQGQRRYLFTAVDLYSRFGFAIGVPRGNSIAAEFFMKLMMEVFPAKIEQVLTDNGSEFCGAFDRCLQEQGIRHCYTYPKCPKMNAFNERFNRTLQEEFVEFEEGLLLTDIREFNERMIDYLLWFNTQRPHYGLRLQTPMAQITQYLPRVSNMCWHHTQTCEAYPTFATISCDWAQSSH